MLRALIALLLLIVSCVASFAERRVALVFGADAYRTLRPLANAVNDARALEQTLRALGFEVYAETDRDLRRMRRALEDFREDAAGADVALAFFAGHGVEIAGENRLLPVDADAASLERLRETSLPLEEVTRALLDAAPVALVLLDACRADPFGDGAVGGRGATAIARRPQSGLSPGLGRVGRADNVLFAFAAAPGKTASDGSGDNSPFTAALVKYLPADGLEIRSVLTLVQQEVYDLSAGAQLPYVESGLPATFFAAQAGELPERERLLLAMADVTPELRTEVESVAAQNGMPLAPLYGALIQNRLGELSSHDRAAKLAEAAQAFIATQEKLRTFASSDPQVERLRAAAEKSLSLGAFAEATAFLDEAIAVDRRASQSIGSVLVERTLSEAASLSAKAGVARAELRHGAAIAALEKAAALHARIEVLDVSDEGRSERTWLLADLGDLYALVGDSNAALIAYEHMAASADLRADRSPDDPDAQRDIAASHQRIGDMRRTQGDLAGALQAHELSLAVAKEISARHPDDRLLRSDLSIGYSKIGDARLAQGDLTGAHDAYAASLAIEEELARREPDNDRAQRDLATAQTRIGDVRRAGGDLRGAVQAYEATLAVFERLAHSEPADPQRQRDLSISHNRIGDVRMAQGDLAGARAAYEASLDIRKKLAARDPGNVEWQSDLALGYNGVGDVLMAQGDLEGAYQAYRAALIIGRQLVARDLDNAVWLRDLTISNNKIGGVLRAQGDFETALEAYQASLAVTARLAARDPGNAERQRDLSINYNRIGDVLRNMADFPGALDVYERALAIADELAARDPANAEWQSELGMCHHKVGDMLLALQQLGEALEHYEESRAIIIDLADRDPGNAEWQRDLVIAYNKTGDARRAQGNLAGAVAAYETGLAIAIELVDRDPGNVEWQRDLIVSNVLLAEVGSRPADRYREALTVARELSASGRLVPADMWMIDDLEERLAAAGAGKEAIRQD